MIVLAPYAPAIHAAEWSFHVVQDAEGRRFHLTTKAALVMGGTILAVIANLVIALGGLVEIPKAIYQMGQQAEQRSELTAQMQREITALKEQLAREQEMRSNLPADPALARQEVKPYVSCCYRGNCKYAAWKCLPPAKPERTP